MMRYKFSLSWVTILVLFAFAESQRTGVNVCRDNDTIPCDDYSECIYRDEWCDKINNCQDGSDEKYCKTHNWLRTINNHCIEGKHFTCDDGRCIPAIALCDKQDDCWDYSDENEAYCNQSAQVLTHTTAVTTSERSSPHSIYDPIIPNRPSTEYTFPTAPTTPVLTNHNSYDYYGRRQKESVDRNEANYPTTRNQPIGVNEPNRPYPRPSGPYNVPNNVPNPYNRNAPVRRQHKQRSGSQQNNNYYNNRRNSQHYNQQSTWDSNNRQRHEVYDYVDREDSYPDYRPSPSRPTYPSASYTTTPPRGTWDTRVPSVRREPETPRGSVVPRQQPQMIQPRVVFHPPPWRQSYYSGKIVKSLSLPRFYFRKDYAYEFGSRYQHAVEKAREWLLEQRDNTSYTWKAKTPRVLVALSLIENNFSSDVVGNELMMKGLQTHLGIALLRNKTNTMPTSRLAMYINALLATCQNPRDFMDLDLVQVLFQRVTYFEHAAEKNPFVYLTLCLSGVSPDRNIIQILMQFIRTEFVDQRTKEQHILATSALACFLHQNPNDYEMREIVDNAIAVLHREKHSDGSYGDIYSTALAAQAFMSVNTTISWDPRRMLDYISAHQNEQDGSFDDFLATYYSIPALSGRGLVHIRNTWCKKTVANQIGSPIDILNPDGPMKSFFISVAVGYPQRTYYSMQLTVRDYANLLDSLRAAEYLDRRFQFESEEFHDMTEVHSISKLSNDPELGWHWYLFELVPTTDSIDLDQKQRIDIKRKIPTNNVEYLFWYLPSV